ncbi:MAG: four helix bundle protein [Calditrichaeota bacterium]|nr:four helix bundle protein [Calditrichota bacterium]HQU74225.1 four helix bundle protein [Calditrichia bacterium]
MAARIQHFRQLNVYRTAFESALRIHQISLNFPREEKYALVDQIRRSSKSVCANLGEAWQRRRYKAAFQAKIEDCKSEASEVQVWLELSLALNYISQEEFEALDNSYEKILAQLIKMLINPDQWLIK